MVFKRTFILEKKLKHDALIKCIQQLHHTFKWLKYKALVMPDSFEWAFLKNIWYYFEFFKNEYGIKNTKI